MEIFCLIYFFLFWRSRARSRYSFLNNVYPDLELEHFFFSRMNEEVVEVGKIP